MNLSLLYTYYNLLMKLSTGLNTTPCSARLQYSNPFINSQTLTTNIPPSVPVCHIPYVPMFIPDLWCGTGRDSFNQYNSVRYTPELQGSLNRTSLLPSREKAEFLKLFLTFPNQQVGFIFKKVFHLLFGHREVHNFAFNQFLGF